MKPSRTFYSRILGKLEVLLEIICKGKLYKLLTVLSATDSHERHKMRQYKFFLTKSYRKTHSFMIIKY